MDRRLFLARAAGLAAFLSAPQASAQRGGAVLDHAVPAAGSIVRGPVYELRLFFTLAIVPSLFRIEVRSSTGAPVPLSGPAVDPPGQIVAIHFKNALPPAIYEAARRFDLAPLHARAVRFHCHPALDGAAAN
jgi:hypothetical protein